MSLFSLGVTGKSIETFFDKPNNLILIFCAPIERVEKSVLIIWLYFLPKIKKYNNSKIVEEVGFRFFKAAILASCSY